MIDAHEEWLAAAVAARECLCGLLQHGTAAGCRHFAACVVVYRLLEDAGS